MTVYKGAIVSCDEGGRVHRYLVEDRGIILHVGDDLPDAYAGGSLVDLGERALLPSFADTHIHFASMALFRSGINVMDARSNKEIRERIGAFLPRTRAKVVIAFGASPHSVEERRLLSREELDGVTGRPVMVVKYDGHACIVNSALLEKLPEGVKSLRGYDRESGEMNQEAFFAVSDYVSGTLSVPDLVRSMQKSIDYMASRGIGLIHTVSGVGFPRDLDVDMERFVGRSAGSGFQMRLFFQTMDVEKVLSRGLPRIGGCFATALDGCFGSRDAALKEPYRGGEDRGVLYYSDKEVTDFCKRANRAGLQIEMHAIGDAAFDQAAKALGAALEDFPREDHRHGIIHACLPTEEGLEICRRYAIHIPLQTSFIDWPQEPGSYLREIMGERERELNPLRRFLDRGIAISAGSDAPCTDPDPLLWIHNACNHSEPSQSLSLEEALRMATWQGCWASFDEKERGSLEAGKRADMVILDRNPHGVPRDELKTIRVESLLLGGRAYRKQSRNWLGAVLAGMVSRSPV